MERSQRNVMVEKIGGADAVEAIEDVFNGDIFPFNELLQG